MLRADPFREFDRLLPRFVGTIARPSVMPVDTYRKGDSFVVQFDLPGVTAESIDLSVEKRVLTVHAERSRPEADDVEVVVAERPQGVFTRQLFLGENLDTERIEAEYTDGVLTLHIPVAETAKPRKVTVNVSTGPTQDAIRAA